MGTAHASTVPQQERFSSRLREFMVCALFALALLIPKVLRLRHNPASWTAFRVILGFLGAGLVVLPLGANSWLAAPAGLCLFLASILLPGTKSRVSADDKARDLGALVVVNGGTYHSNEGKRATVQLFVGAERISVLDSSFDTLLVVPTADIVSVLANPSGNSWTLRMTWSGGAAEFSYQGYFAEHLARIAQSTVQSVMPAQLLVLQKTRAASA
jgi:hypothetical protein